MDLPEVFQPRRAEENFHRIRLSAFPRSIIRDYDLRPNSVRERFGVRTGLPMTLSDEQVDRPNAVVWTGKLELLVPCEITQIQHTKLAERDVAADRLFVLGVTNRLA